MWLNKTVAAGPAFWQWRVDLAVASVRPCFCFEVKPPLTFRVVLMLALFAGILVDRGPAQVAADPGATMIVLDASSSMRGRIGGEAKMEIAKRVVRELIESLPDDAILGLVVYGHRRISACDDIELLIPAGPLDKAAFVAVVDALQPRGMTPLSASLTFAAEALDYRRSKASIILVTDGLETCGRDPCATAQALKDAAADLTVHTVAFDLRSRDARAIACIARTTGGRALEARDASTLHDALEITLTEAVTATPPPASEIISEATLNSPAEVTMGTKFAVAWTGPDNAEDFIAVARPGASDDVYETFNYTRRGSPLELTAPIEAGPAELRYLTGESRRVLARQPLSIVPAAVRIEAVSEAVAGDSVTISWVGPNNAGDYLTIVAKDAAEGEYEALTGTTAGSPLQVIASVRPGGAEIRYMSGQGAKILARRDLTVLPPAATLRAAGEVAAGAAVRIEWSGPGNAGDFLTIVPKNAPDDRYGDFAGTNVGAVVSVRAPLQPGEAEIRYLTGQGAQVLARRSLVVTDAAITLSAPRSAVAGSPVAIVWTGPDSVGDFLTIVAKSAGDDRYERYANTTAGSPITVVAPATVGPAEIRYVSGRDNRVLARIEIELTAPER